MRKLKTFASLLLAVAIAGLSTIAPAFADYDPGFDVDAESVYLINLDTGKVIYEKDADKKIYLLQNPRSLIPDLHKSGKYSYSALIISMSSTINSLPGAPANSAPFLLEEQMIENLYFLAGS